MSRSTPPGAWHWERARAGAIIIPGMRRVVFAAIFVGLVPGVAIAKPLQKVRVETEPRGASVYLNDKDNGAKCKTPREFDVPVGDAPPGDTPARPPDPPEAQSTLTAEPRRPIFILSVATDVGFRDFNYENLRGPNPMMPSNQRSHFDEGGQVLVGGQVEFYPGVL